MTILEDQIDNIQEQLDNIEDSLMAIGNSLAAMAEQLAALMPQPIEQCNLAESVRERIKELDEIALNELNKRPWHERRPMGEV